MGLWEELTAAMPEGRLLRDEPLKSHTSFKIGGPADMMAVPSNGEELARVVAVCRSSGCEYTLLGNGTNVLASDEGYRGVVILTRGLKDNVEITHDAHVYASAGCALSRVAMDVARSGLSGLEFAAGIPGTLGGAVVMNAGAYGSDISAVLEYATILDENGELHRMTAEELELGYRTSNIAERGYVVVDASMKLKEASSIGIIAKIAALAEQRREKQPLEYPSAGSTFKRPEGHYAGQLIEEAGLRGYRVGDAMVSEKHCGFVINAGAATAADVMELIRQVQKRVQDRSGVLLEPEIKLIGRF